MPTPPSTALTSTRRWPPSQWIAAGLALCVLAPVLVLAALAASGETGHWLNLLQNVLPVSLSNTVLLLVGVGILSAMIGGGSAWLTTAYLFPSRKLVTWGLLLPLAVPTYIMAFAYLDVLHPLGPIQTLIRDLLGYDSPRQFRLPDLRSMPGAIILLGLVLYPYVYLSVRVMFMTQAASLLEAARTLGCSRREAFWRVVVPLARPAMAVGLSLALLETLNDVGASEFLGIQTMTISIYTTWITRSNLQGAAQIAIVMLAVVTLLIYMERYARRRQRYAITQRMHPIQPVQLRGLAALVAMLLETILSDMGCAVVGPESNVGDGLRVVASEIDLDAALLDVNVAGQEVFPIAEALKARGVPFVFSTGYGESGLPEHWRGNPTVQKPFTAAAIRDALMAAMNMGMV